MTGEIHIKIEQFKMHFTDIYYDVLIQGDGYAKVWPR